MPRLILCHTPVLGCIFGLFLMIMAVVRGSRELMVGALWLFLLAGLAAIPTYISGEQAEDMVEHLPGVSAHTIDQHQESAEVSLAGVEALGALALIWLLLLHLNRRVPRWLASLILVLAVAVSASMIWTAWLGSFIGHPEIHASPSSSTALHHKAN